MKTPCYDVLVIGAGVAGLAAARALAVGGRRTAVVEARKRIGGRILTHHIAAADGGPPIPIELGAEFIHGLPRETWALIEEAEMKTYELDGAELCVRNAALTADSGPGSGSHRVLDEMSRWLESQPPGTDMSFADYLDRNDVSGAPAQAATAYVEGFNAANKRRIGIASLTRQQQAEDAVEADRLFHVAAGYDSVPAYLAEEFVRAGGNLILGKAVERISWKNDSVTLSVRDDTGRGYRLHGRKAVVSVPLGVLQARTLAFDPEPGHRLQQAARLAMGPVIRVVMMFHRRFWLDYAAKRPELEQQLMHLSFLFDPAEAPATWWTPMPKRTPMLVGWSGGAQAEALLRPVIAAGGPRALLAHCLANLGKIFEMPVADLERLLLSWHFHDWQADVRARGAYSYVPAGASDAPEQLAQPVEDTLYFAGEHTDVTGHWGTVHAAIGTGIRAAAQILSKRA